jgi:hypothetical protein
VKFYLGFPGRRASGTGAALGIPSNGERRGSVVIRLGAELVVLRWLGANVKNTLRTIAISRLIPGDWFGKYEFPYKSPVEKPKSGQRHEFTSEQTPQVALAVFCRRASGRLGLVSN